MTKQTQRSEKRLPEVRTAGLAVARGQRGPGWALAGPRRRQARSGAHSTAGSCASPRPRTRGAFPPAGPQARGRRPSAEPEEGAVGKEQPRRAGHPWARPGCSLPRGQAAPLWAALGQRSCDRWSFCPVSGRVCFLMNVMKGRLRHWRALPCGQCGSDRGAARRGGGGGSPEL